MNYCLIYIINGLCVTGWVCARFCFGLILIYYNNESSPLVSTWWFMERQIASSFWFSNKKIYIYKYCTISHFLPLSFLPHLSLLSVRRWSGPMRCAAPSLRSTAPTTQRQLKETLYNDHHRLLWQGQGQHHFRLQDPPSIISYVMIWKDVSSGIPPPRPDSPLSFNQAARNFT